MNQVSTRPPRVLIAEDDAIGAEFIKAILDSVGYRIAGVAATADEAVALAQSENPDVVLMDIYLRGPETGIDAARRIHLSSDVPVIYLTAFANDALVAEACPSEPYAYLVKPARERELHAAIETALLRARTLARLRRINSILSAMKTIGASSAAAASPAELLDRACNALVDSAGFLSACAALPSPSGDGFDWTCAAGADPDFFRSLLLSPDALPKLLDWRNGRTAVCRPADADFPFAADFASRNVGAAVSLPISHQDRRIGILCLFVPENADFTSEEIGLLEEIAAQTGLAAASIEATARLAESEARYRTFFENDNVAIVLVDPSSLEIVDANPAAAALYGWPLDRLVAMRLDQIVDLPPAELKIDLARAARRECSLFAHRNRLANGSAREVEVSVGPLRMGDRQLLYGIVQDVTVRKRLEEELRQASKMEAVGRLAGGIAHDFNNIVQSIVGNAELASLAARRGQIAEIEIKEILDAGKRAGEVTRQLLAFGRRQALLPKPTDINAKIQAINLFLKRIIGENVSLEYRLGDNLPPVLLDPIQLDQTLLNLCANARDAMPGGGTVSIETSAVALDADFCAARSPLQPGVHVRMRVADHGVGMDPETLKHLFEPFFTTKDSGKGTGLGLATVYGIMTQHGGWIDVSSSPGRGTAFDLFWPCALMAPESAVEPSPPDPEAKGGSETILIVEDEPGVQLAMRRILSTVGYNVVLSSNGRQAIDRIRAGFRPNLAIVDMIMPEMGGMEFSRILAAEFPSVRYLLCSAHSAEMLAGEGNPSPPRILQKPFTFNYLLRQVREALDAPLPA